MKIGPEGIDPLYAQGSIYLYDMESTQNFVHLMPGALAMADDQGYTIHLGLGPTQLRAIRDWAAHQLDDGTEEVPR